MTPLFKKLNFRNQKSILILNAPDSFLTETESMSAVTHVKNRIGLTDSIEFILAFVTTQQEIETLSPVIETNLTADAVLWFSYPKGTSKKYKATINRDNGWQILGTLGFEPVRSVAIDEDWSAIRFRKAENIKKMTRSKEFAMSAEGKDKTGGR